MKKPTSYWSSFNDSGEFVGRKIRCDLCEELKPENLVFRCADADESYWCCKECF
jgi:hypothetical protein